MDRSWTLAVALFAALAAGTPTAWAGEAVGVSAGVGVGLMADLGDRASAGAEGAVPETAWGPGFALVVPIRVAVHDLFRLRVDPRFEFASGRDQLTWGTTLDGLTVRVQDDGSSEAWLAVAGLDLGAEAVLPVRGPVRPYLQASFGLWGVGTFHALRGNSLVLLDPARNDVGDPSNLDPYTLQFVPGGHLGAGVLAKVSPGVHLAAEVSYGGGFVGPAGLRKTDPDAQARREAFALNPVRATVSVLFSRPEAD